MQKERSYFQERSFLFQFTAAAAYQGNRQHDLLVFHARPYPGFKGDALSDPNRHCFLRKVRYDDNGIPVFRQLDTDE